MRRRTIPSRAAVVAAGVAVLTAVGAGCGGDDEPSETTVAIANPASVFCEEQGGQVEIVDEAGGQVGYCILPDGRRIEEWEYFRSQTATTSTP